MNKAPNFDGVRELNKRDGPLVHLSSVKVQHIIKRIETSKINYFRNVEREKE